MSVIHAPEERPLELRLIIAPAVLGLILGAFFIRLWVLQVVGYDDALDRASSSAEITVKKSAPRGMLFDRNGALLGGVRPTVVVTANPRVALKNPDAIQRVADILGTDAATLTKAIKNVDYAGDLPVPVFVGADIVAGTKIAEQPELLTGFGVETQAMRYYVDPIGTGQILGYVRAPSKADIERLKAAKIEPGATVGKQGLELQYDKLLMGTAGKERQRVDARRRAIITNINVTDEPVPGSTLYLSLDLKFQNLALQLLAGRKGSVVALDPRNGEVLCLASSPTYDTSLFLKGISKDDYQSLLNDPAKPMFFRATGGAYAPGSTFKVVTTIAAWLTDKFSLSATAFCPGYVQVGNKKVKCLGTHGSIAYDRAFSHSCNAYFGNLAKQVGREGLLEACDKVGLGHKTGIDLPAEATGLVPTPDWWAKNRDRKWSLGDTVNFGIGQGELATTPLQMASVVSLVANRGVSYKPHLLKSTLGPKEGAKPELYKPEVLGQIDATPDRWDALFRAMFHVVTEGTARGVAQISGLEWGGKTGSAENRKDHETHSWFVGMAPIDSPTLVICVMVENAGHGSEVAAPIGTRLVKYWLKERGKAPRVDVQSAVNSSAVDETLPADSVSPDSR